LRRIERALISVYDKTGILDFARGLAALQVEILATGSTYKHLSSAGIAAREVADYTGFPEILDGRVKTLHPRIAGGLLAIRSNPEHMRQAEQNQVKLIDLLCVNLYPFAETIRKPGVSFEEVIENIDIGGPSMIRAAAKNFQDVAVLTSPEDYGFVLESLKTNNGLLDRETLFKLSRKALLCTARYDAQIAQHLSTSAAEGPSPFPTNLFMDFEKISDLRYGENPHQKAAFYRSGGRSPSGLAAARQHQGKELSYNNIVDLDAAWNLVREFDDPACCVIKHTNPCGTATGTTLRDAYVKAYEADSQSAFGSVIGFNRVLDGATAEELAKLFVEAVVAPGADEQALRILSGKKNLRLLTVESSHDDKGEYRIHRISGGILLQESDNILIGSESRVVTRRQPTEAEYRDLLFAWRVVKHVKSNAIVLAHSGVTLGVGAGQMSRVDSVKISIQKARSASKEAVLASDAFFPFRDSVDEAGGAGVTAIIQPGGSVRDDEVIRAADEYGMAMIFTGLRHFKH
jgi:phosphoribosylaminoimidazolecarboxamide formyltransferase / IMP cyclohydrolase